MIMKRILGAAALFLVFAPAIGAQEPTDPMAGMRGQMDSMHGMMQEMHQMMMSMHGQGGGQGGMMMMGGMQGMGMQPDAGAPMGAGCPAQSDAGLAGLVGGSIGAIELTDAQRAELQAILANARAEALEKLTPEQRARLEIAPGMGTGACGATHQPVNPNH